MSWVDRILDLLYPPRCAFCHRFTEGEIICKWCRKDLPYTRGAEQSQKFSHVSCCVSPLFYEGNVRQSLLRYKFRGCTRYAEIYGDFLSKCIDENEISCDIITWVPLSRRRLRRRGYDQARLIAEDLAKRQGIACVQLLKKIRNNPAQSGSGSAEKRRANVAGIYQSVNREFLDGKRILLVDDIVTTGATISECARTLKAAGAASVCAAAVARHRE